MEPDDDLTFDDLVGEIIREEEIERRISESVDGMEEKLKPPDLPKDETVH